MTEWPATNQSCQHCDDELSIGGKISLADCDICGTTCCDACYELHHAFGPCDAPERKRTETYMTIEVLIAELSDYDPKAEVWFQSVRGAEQLLSIYSERKSNIVYIDIGRDGE